MIVMTFNLRAWTRDRDKSQPTYWKNRLDAIVRCIRDVNPDILCVQECLPRMLKPIKALGYKVAGCSVSHHILTKKGIKAKNHHFSIFWEWCEVGCIRIINVHGRWEQRIVNEVADRVNSLAAGRKAIACGDFNTGAGSLAKAGLGLRHVRTELGLKAEDTFQNFTKAQSHGEIDHFYVNLITPETYRVIRDNYGCPGRMSDHYLIVMTY